MKNENIKITIKDEKNISERISADESHRTS